MYEELRQNLSCVGWRPLEIKDQVCAYKEYSVDSKLGNRVLVVVDLEGASIPVSNTINKFGCALDIDEYIDSIDTCGYVPIANRSQSELLIDDFQEQGLSEEQYQEILVAMEIMKSIILQ